MIRNRIAEVKEENNNVRTLGPGFGGGGINQEKMHGPWKQFISFLGISIVCYWVLFRHSTCSLVEVKEIDGFETPNLVGEGSSSKWQPKLYVYSFFSRPDDEKHPTMKQKYTKVGYFVCPIAAALQEYGHELRILGLSAKINITDETFSGTFFDGTVVKNRPAGGNRHMVKLLFWFNLLDEAAAAARFERDPAINYMHKPDDVILFIDAMDVIFTRDPISIVESLRAPDGGPPQKNKPQTIIAGELKCHPFSCARERDFCVGRDLNYTLAGGRVVPGETLCDEMDRLHGGRFNYANGGFLWGTSEGFRQLRDFVPEFLASGMEYSNDQGLLQMVPLIRPDLLAVETEMKYAYIGASGNMTEEYGLLPEEVLELPENSPLRKAWPTSKFSGHKPVALHFNGDAKVHWRSAKQLVKQMVPKKDGQKNVKAYWIDVDNGSTRVECQF